LFLRPFGSLRYIIVNNLHKDVKDKDDDDDDNNNNNNVIRK